MIRPDYDTRKASLNKLKIASIKDKTSPTNLKLATQENVMFDYIRALTIIIKSDKTNQE